VIHGGAVKIGGGAIQELRNKINKKSEAGAEIARPRCIQITRVDQDISRDFLPEESSIEGNRGDNLLHQINQVQTDITKFKSRRS
jgi:hypothetical protein